MTSYNSASSKVYVRSSTTDVRLNNCLLLILISTKNNHKWDFLRINNNPADSERSELVGKIAKLIQQSIAKKGLQ